LYKKRKKSPPKNIKIKIKIKNKVIWNVQVDITSLNHKHAVMPICLPVNSTVKIRQVEEQPILHQCG
jgi:hypothetical protein